MLPAQWRLSGAGRDHLQPARWTAPGRRHLRRRLLSDAAGDGDAGAAEDTIREAAEAGETPDDATLAERLTNRGRTPLARQMGWGRKSVENLFEAIEARRAIPLDRLIFSLGIRHIGESAAKLLARNYGTRADAIVADAESLDQLGTHFGADLYEAEVRYLVEREWAMTADDILWRRSKLGLHLSEEERGRLATWMGERDDLPAAETTAP